MHEDIRVSRVLFEAPALDSQERDVIATIDELRQTLRHFVAEPRRWTGLLRRVAFARAIRGSNSIEGFHVSMDDALAATDREEPLDSDRESWVAVNGYRSAMTYILQLAGEQEFTYSVELIRSLHFMMQEYDLGMRPGRWRMGEIFVMDETTGATVYTGPPAEAVPSLMDALTDELNDGDGHVLVRAGLAHLNLVMIHPFRDGNGRMGRALQTLVLAREGILAPPFSSIEEYLGANQQDYYDELARVGQGRWDPPGDTRPWIRFTLRCHLHQAQTILTRARESESVWSMLEELVARHGLPERSMIALYDAAFGFKVRNPLYRGEAEIAEYSAGRDLRSMVERGLLVPVGEKRGRYYVAAEPVAEIRRRAAQTRPTFEDPFESPI